MQTKNHASPSKEITKTTLQGSDAQSSKTLHNLKTAFKKIRFQLDRLMALHR
jgi:hypothetical protein